MLGAGWAEPGSARTVQGDARELVTRVRALEGELGALGYRFDGELDAPVEVEVLGAGEYALACGAELERRFGPHWSELRRYLGEALGIDAGQSAAETTVRAAQGWYGGSPALYRLESRGIAVDLSRASSPGLERALVRALVHAWRDRESGLEGRLGSPRTTERVLLVSALAAGEAEVAALALDEARAKPGAPAGSSLATLDVSKLADPAPEGASELVRELHRAGRDFVLARARKGGLDEARKVFDSPPASCEQLLHALKLPSDAPATTSFPAIAPELGLEILRDDVLGELALRALLVDAGVERAKAQLASIGWDGDRILLFRTREGDLGLLWRVVFDRHEDVKQFGSAFTTSALGQPVARGFALDWVRCDSVAVTQSLLAQLLGTKAGVTPDPGDQESTAEAEIELADAADARPRLAGGWWIHPRFQLSVPAPEGWAMELVDEQTFLAAPPVQGFKDKLAVTALDGLRGRTLDEVLELHRAQLGSQPDFVLEIAEKRVVDGREVALLRYAGSTGAQDLVFTRMLVPYGGRPIAVVATVAKSTWPERRPVIEATFEKLRFRVLDPRAGDR